MSAHVKQSTADRVKNVIATMMGIEPARVTDDATLATDLGADSIDMVEISIALEEEFPIEISDDMLEGMKTVGDALSAVDLAMEGRAHG